MALLLIPLLVHCGGQSELISIEPSSGGSTNASAGGSTGLSGSASAGGSMSLPLDGGLSCNMRANQYDNTCSVDSDCVGVPDVDPCSNLCPCPTAALNARVAYQYRSDFAALNAGRASGVCNCPCIAAPCCRQGVCYNSCGMCSFSN